MQDLKLKKMKIYSGMFYVITSSIIAERWNNHYFPY